MALAGARGRHHGLSQRHGPVRGRPAPGDRHRCADRHARRSRDRGHRSLRGSGGFLRPGRRGSYGRWTLRHLLPPPVRDRGPAWAAGPARPAAGRHRHDRSPLSGATAPSLRRPGRRQQARLPRPPGLPPTCRAAGFAGSARGPRPRRGAQSRSGRAARRALVDARRTTALAARAPLRPEPPPLPAPGAGGPARTGATAVADFCARPPALTGRRRAPEGPGGRGPRLAAPLRRPAACGGSNGRHSGRAQAWRSRRCTPQGGASAIAGARALGPAG